MQIDAFTLAAQIFNFALLVVLLRVVLYRPILDAIRRREAEVAARLEEARARRNEADEEVARYRRETARVEDARTQVLAEAEEEAAALRERLSAAAREEVEVLRREWHQAVAREREGFLSELRTSVVREAFAIARRALHALAEADLESQLMRVFVRNLEQAGEDDREEFRQAVEAGDGAVRVKSARALGDDHRALLRRTLERWLGREVEVEFVVDRSLGLGLEALALDRKIGWSAATYVDPLQAEVEELLERVVK